MIVSPEWRVNAWGIVLGVSLQVSVYALIDIVYIRAQSIKDGQ